MLGAVALASSSPSLRVCTTQQRDEPCRRATKPKAVSCQHRLSPLKFTKAYQGDFSRKQSSCVSQSAVAIIGPPVYLAPKIAVCGMSLAIAAPAAAVSSLSDGPSTVGVDGLVKGEAHHCGPPDALSPS